MGTPELVTNSKPDTSAPMREGVEWLAQDRRTDSELNVR